MKISLKIFVFTYCLMMMVTIVGGFILIDTSYRENIYAAREKAIDDNKMLYTYVATLEELPDSSYAEYSLAGLVQRMSQNAREQVLVGDYKAWRQKIVPQNHVELSKEQIVVSIISTDGGRAFQVTSRCEDKYIINYYEITEILAQRDANYRLYRNVIILASVIIAIILYLFSWYITRPLVKVTDMAESLADGDYSVRVDSSYKKMKSYEVQKLGETLNLMAGNTEEYIARLKEEARRKEDFMGNFTHEIKTPMTSIIGYADLLRTYDLSPDKRREYGSFIYNEGKRMEQLAQNLLQLIVLEKNDFEMVEVNTKVIFELLKNAVRFVGEKYQVQIIYEQEDARIKAEVSLIMSALANLIDNACKASKAGESVIVDGKVYGDEYIFAIKDSGRGIPADELEKILEPFYMVDKSRARSQGGAGLGLALCAKIVHIHGGNLNINSEPGVGTCVELRLKIAEKGGAADEETL